MDDCPLRKVREIKIEEPDEYWLDKVNLVLLKKIGPTAAPDGCPNILLQQTEYEYIFLTHNNTAFLPLGDK